MTPELALAQLADLAPEVREGVVLGPGGERLAGSPALAGPARELFRRTEAGQAEVVTPRGAVFAQRDGRHAIAVVTARSALPAVMHSDLRMTLAALAGGHGNGAGDGDGGRA